MHHRIDNAGSARISTIACSFSSLLSWPTSLSISARFVRQRLCGQLMKLPNWSGLLITAALAVFDLVWIGRIINFQRDTWFLRPRAEILLTIYLELLLSSTPCKLSRYKVHVRLIVQRESGAKWETSYISQSNDHFYTARSSYRSFHRIVREIILNEAIFPLWQYWDILI